VGILTTRGIKEEVGKYLQWWSAFLHPTSDDLLCRVRIYIYVFFMISPGNWEWFLHSTWDTEKIVFYYGAIFSNTLLLFNYIYSLCKTFSMFYYSKIRSKTF